MNASFPSAVWIRIISVTLTALTAFDVPTFLSVGMFSSGGLAPSTTWTPSTTTMGTFAYTGAAPTAQILLPIGPPPEFSRSALPWESTRLTAVAALFTNVSQVLTKNGTVLAGRVAPQIEDPFNATSAVLTALHPAEKSYLGLETGLYTYCPPSTDLDTFWDYSGPLNILNVITGPTYTTAPIPVYRLDNTSLVNIACFDSAAGSNPVLAVNLDWHIEFRTTSALFQIGMSTMTLESLHYAQLSLHEAGFFFENPEHKGVLTKVMSKVSKYAAVAAPIASAVHPTAGKALGALATGSKIIRGSKGSPPASRLQTTPAKPKPKPKAKRAKR